MSNVIELGASPDTAVWAARQTVRMHEETLVDDRATGRCKQCRPDGSCPQRVWAVRVLGYLNEPPAVTRSVEWG